MVAAVCINFRGYTKKGLDKSSPNGVVTRAQLVQILYAMENKPEVKADMFSDVKKGKWFWAAVNWAAANGIVSGYENGKFGPNDAVTRQQMIAILYQYAKETGANIASKGNLAQFRDAGLLSNYAVAPMKWAVGNGIISGTKVGLEPKSSGTRAQLAVIIKSLKENVLDALSGKDGKDGKDGADGKDGLTPFIGSNGNWWIGDKDTGISAQGKDGKDGANGKDGADGKDGKDGATPYVGDNGNWWINGKDTGVYAFGKDGRDGFTPYIGKNGNWWIDDKDTGTPASGDSSDESQEPGDEIVFLPGSKFEWTSDDGVKFYFDKVDITYFAEVPFEPGNNNPAERFMQNVPEDSTYTDEYYKNVLRQWVPNIYRVEMQGHVDDSLAGCVIDINTCKMDCDTGRYYQAFVEEDGSFSLVYYQNDASITSMYFAGARIAYDPNNLNTHTFYPQALKACYRLPGNVLVYNNRMEEYEDELSTFTFLLVGSDEDGNPVKKTTALKDGRIIFKNVPVTKQNDNELDGYEVFAYRTEKGEETKTSLGVKCFVQSGGLSEVYFGFDSLLRQGSIKLNLTLNGKPIDPSSEYDLEIRVSGKTEFGMRSTQYGDKNYDVVPVYVSSDEGYTVTVIYHGFNEKTTMDIDNVVVREGETTTVDVPLVCS